MSSHQLAKMLLELPDLPVIITANVKGKSGEIIFVGHMKNFEPDCRCETGFKINEGIEIFCD